MCACTHVHLACIRVCHLCVCVAMAMRNIHTSHSVVSDLLLHRFYADELTLSQVYPPKFETNFNLA